MRLAYLDRFLAGDELVEEVLVGGALLEVAKERLYRLDDEATLPSKRAAGLAVGKDGNPFSVCSD